MFQAPRLQIVRAMQDIAFGVEAFTVRRYVEWVAASALDELLSAGHDGVLGFRSQIAFQKFCSSSGSTCSLSVSVDQSSTK